MASTPLQNTVPTKYWHARVDGRIHCDLCPRACKLREGQRGLCFVRANEELEIVLTTYGRSSGFCVDPIEKEPLDLQDRECHNINFVTPEHVVPQVLEAVALAVGRGLDLPIVYNTSAYDSLESLELMDGIVDIYMPDFKYRSAGRSRTYMKAEDYPEAARAAVKEMHRQVG